MQNGKNSELSEFVKEGQRYFDSERLWYSKLSLLKLRAVELAILDQIFVKKVRQIKFKNFLNFIFAMTART